MRNSNQVEITHIITDGQIIKSIGSEIVGTVPVPSGKLT